MPWAPLAKNFLGSAFHANFVQDKDGKKPNFGGGSPGFFGGGVSFFLQGGGP